MAGVRGVFFDITFNGRKAGNIWIERGNLAKVKSKRSVNTLKK